MCETNGRADPTHQLHTVPLLVPLLRFVVGALHLHGLEGLGQVVALGEVLGPLRNVGLQEGSLLAVMKNPLCVCVCE